MTRFVLDVHLGKLAAYLRMLGFDTFYRNCLDDPELAQISADEGRVLLTRDRELLKRNLVTQGYWVEETDSKRQLAEIVRQFALAGAIRPFTRCMACNELIRKAPKEDVIGQVPPRAAASHEEYWQCPRCRRVYWQGTHYARMRRWIEELTA